MKKEEKPIEETPLEESVETVPPTPFDVVSLIAEFQALDDLVLAVRSGNVTRDFEQVVEAVQLAVTAVRTSSCQSIEEVQNLDAAFSETLGALSVMATQYLACRFVLDRKGEAR